MTPARSPHSLIDLVRSRLPQLRPWRPAVHTRPFPAAPRRSIFIRHVDCGSCAAAEQEIAALFNPVYDIERFGFQLVASPRHADLLLLTGPLTRNMHAALLAAFQAMPPPRRVVTIGSGFDLDSLYAPSYAILPLPAEILSARILHIPGDPPAPAEILEALLQIEIV